jgi:hypothetical protein
MQQNKDKAATMKQTNRWGLAALSLGLRLKGTEVSWEYEGKEVYANYPSSYQE